MNDKDVDLPLKALAELKRVFAAYPEVESAIIFGSRATGNAKSGSDIDCALSGETLTPQIVEKIHSYLEEETLLPYFFDCIHVESLQNQALLKHIREQGKQVYEKQRNG